MPKAATRLTFVIGFAGLTTVVLALLALSSARAADGIYWSSYEAAKISRADLAGGGGLDLPLGGPSSTLENPYGTAIDTATGQVYWSNYSAGTIGHSFLDGSGAALLNTSGATMSGPAGVAIDPGAGKIYWANATSTKISYANLDGSGGGDLNTAGATVNRPYGVTFYPATNRVYWANLGADKISYANLDGSGGGDLDTTGASVVEPIGVAIDPATGRIYWANFSGNTISYANLSGGGGGQLGTGTVLDEPTGLAIDVAAGRIYWPNSGSNTIGYANLDGGGGQLNTGTATLKYPSFPVLLQVPLGIEPPLVSGGHQPGATLSCTQGGWGGDVLEALDNRAPRSFSYQWLRQGTAIGGATSGTLTAATVGDYACQVTATNFAGSSSQVSAALNVSASVALGKAKLNKKKGTAKLSIQLTGSGLLVLSGKGIAGRRRANANGAISLTVKATGKAAKTLSSKGKVKVNAKIAYTPTGGTALKKTKTIVLMKQLG